MRIFELYNKSNTYNHLAEVFCGSPSVAMVVQGTEDNVCCSSLRHDI